MRKFINFITLFLFAGALCTAQVPQMQQQAPPPPPPPDTKPASTNIVGAEYPRIDAQRRAYFRLRAPEAQSIVVSLGNTALTKGEDGYWTGVTAPLDPGFHYYTIRINGVDVADPNSETFFGSGKVMSGIEVPEEGVDFYDIKKVPHGNIVSFWYYAESTGEHRQAFVYTPPDYNKDISKRYPVLYLQHGMGEDRRAWANQGKTNFILDNLIAEGKAKPMIVVMEDGGIAAGMRAAVLRVQAHRVQDPHRALPVRHSRNRHRQQDLPWVSLREQDRHSDPARALEVCHHFGTASDRY